MSAWRHPVQDPPEPITDVLFIEVTDEGPAIDLGFVNNKGRWSYTGAHHGPDDVRAWRPLPPIPSRDEWPEALGPYPEVL